MKQVIVALVAAVAVTAAAHAQQSPSSTPPEQSSAQQGALVDANSIIGSTVRSQGKDVGKVERLMLDPRDGRVRTIVMSIGSTLGIGGKTLSMPWEQVKLAQDGSKLVVMVEQQLLDQAPRSESERRDRSSSPAASPSTSESPSPGAQPGQPPAPPK